MPDSGKTRSPLYPAIGLGEAITRVEMLYKKEHRHIADKEVIAKAIGYNGVNGASVSVISALSKYGLLDTLPTGQRVSPLALEIITRHIGEPERVEAIRDAATRPALFRNLFEQYGDEIPSDTNLRSYLLRSGFNPNTVVSVIRAYHDTLEFVNGETGELPGKSTEVVRLEDAMQTQLLASGQATQSAYSFPEAVSRSVPPIAPVNQANNAEHGSDFVFRIGDGCTVRGVFTGEVTQEAIEKFKQHLELVKDTYPTRSQLVTQIHDDTDDDLLNEDIGSQTA